MSSRIAQLADAVAAEINRGVWDPPLTAERRYYVQFELKELDSLKVVVVPRNWSSEISTRAANENTAQVQVGFQQRTNPDDLSVVDGLMATVENVHEFLDRRRLVDDPAASWLGAEQDPLYDQEVLRQNRMFLAVLTLTYRLRA